MRQLLYRSLALLPAPLLAFVLALRPVENFDLGFNLRIGELVQRQGVPVTDPFSFPGEGKRWIVEQWLGPLWFWLVYNSAGLTGLLVFKALIVAAAFALAFLAAREACGSSVLASVAALLAAAAGAVRFNAQPFVFSFVGTALVSLALHRLRARRSWGLLLALPLLFALWPHVHPGYLTGLAALGAFTGGALLEALFLRGAGQVGAGAADAEAGRDQPVDLGRGGETRPARGGELDGQRAPPGEARPARGGELDMERAPPGEARHARGGELDGQRAPPGEARAARGGELDIERAPPGEARAARGGELDGERAPPGEARPARRGLVAVGPPGRFALRDTVRLALVTAACAAAAALSLALFHPLGVATLWRVLDIFSADATQQYISEFAPLWRSYEIDAPMLLLALLPPLAWALAYRELSLPLAALHLLFVVAAARVGRLVTDAAIVLAPIWAYSILLALRALSGSLSRLARLATPRRLAAVPALICVLAAAGPLSRLELDWPARFYPRACYDWIDAHHLPPRQFNDLWFGGSFIFHFSPRRKTFIDGRSFYDDRFFRDEYLPIREAAPGWQKVAERWGIEWFLLRPDRFRGLHEALRKDPRYRLVHSDEQCTIYAAR